LNCLKIASVRFRQTIILISLAFASLNLSVRVSAQNNWVMTNPAFTAVTYGPAGFLAYGWTPLIGGSPSAFYTSGDGETWIPRPKSDFISLSLSADENFYYSLGFLLTFSTNGLSWKPLVSEAFSLSAMAFSSDSDLAVCVGNRTILFSTNRIDWVRQPFGEESWLGVAYRDGRFVTVGEHGAIASSTNGVAWELLTSQTAYRLRSITRGPTGFVAAGEQGTIVFSEDGRQWKTVPSGTTNLLMSVASGAGKFVVVGATNTILFSSDGQNWSKVPSDSTALLRSVCFGNGHFVAVGEEGTILSSEDGEHWTLRHYVPNYMQKIYFGGGQFLALGSSGKYSLAQNPHLWTNASLGNYDRLTCATYSLNKWVVGTGTNTFLVSSNLSEWLSAPTPPGTSANDICFGDDLFVAAGDQGTILTSKDALAWRQRTTGKVTLRGVVYGNHKYVAVGASGTIVSSDDGISWTWRASGDVTFYSVTYGKGLFVAVGDRSGTTAISPDGVNWTQLHIGSQLYDITFSDNQFFTVGDFGSMISSRDGRNWQYRNAFSGNISFVVYGKGHFLVPALGVLWQGDLDFFISALKATENQFELEVSPPASESVLESSVDFKSWREEAVVPASDEAGALQIPRLQGDSQRFFRMRQP
jgi:photosystem II stability/assembly factor-like uncharacterized protein